MKTYPDGSWEIMASDRSVFMPDGWELADRWDIGKKQDLEESEAKESSAQRASRRARVMVRDLARSNDFSWFVTLTLDQSRVDRYDMREITRKLNAWLDNQVRRAGLLYVLVPERHKDGAVHFHGLFNDALAAVNSGTFAGPWDKPRRPRTAAQRAAWEGEPELYHPVFNLPAWTLGFTTAIRLYGDRERSIAYVLKYIGKQGEKPGGRWYYSGGALRRPEISYPAFGFSDVADMPGAYVFQVEAAKAAFAIMRGKGDIGCG